jgi:hypothetical protein
MIMWKKIVRSFILPFDALSLLGTEKNSAASTLIFWFITSAESSRVDQIELLLIILNSSAVEMFYICFSFSLCE